LRRAPKETRATQALETEHGRRRLRAPSSRRALAADSARLDKLTKRTVEVDLTLKEQRVRLLDALRGLKLWLPDSRASHAPRVSTEKTSGLSRAIASSRPACA